MVFGVSGLGIEELDSGEGTGEAILRASYTMWLPDTQRGESPDIQPPSGTPQGTAYTDELRLVRRKDLWRIAEIIREPGGTVSN
jgi:hypothetical protein